MSETRAGGWAGGAVAMGVDYGTESGRVLLLDLESGAELASEVVAYPHGVIEEELPGGGGELGPDWALQHPLDYLAVLEQGVPAALRAGGVDPARVVGIGLDVTSCTVLPALADGTALCTVEGWRERPHAWPKLWKHHAAQPVADRLNEVAGERGESFLSRYGGRISSEWYFPKLIQVFLEDRQTYEAMGAFVEATDWIVWQLTGKLARSACAAGYKAFWSAREGLPSADYFAAAYPGFDRPAEKLGTSFHALGNAAGGLEAGLAGRLGLPAGIAVAVGNVDSFVSVPGCGVTDPGTLVSVIGTSTCDMVVHPREVRLPGITGVVEDGILPGLYGYEAGQPAVGDMFAWFLRRLLGVEGSFARFEEAAAELAPGSTGLVALDWWNGNRSVLGDAGLSGVLAGLTLQTTPVQVYRALLEAVAFGARRIVDNFGEHGMPVERIVACGGIAERSSLSMQLLADVTGREVEVAGSPQVPARGSALFGAIAAGSGAGGFDDLATAAERLTPPPARAFRPQPAASAAYDEVYRVYLDLHEVLGREHPAWLHTLRAIRDRRPGPA